MRNYVFIAIAVWALTGCPTFAIELPAPDSGFDWNRAYAGIFGVCLGSFMNVCIARMPEDRSVVHPRSACRPTP